MSEFLKRLREARSDETGRDWYFLSYDQLFSDCGPVASHDPGELGLVLAENEWKAGRRPYHKQKLALVLANQRHFALEQSRRGVAVRYRFHDGPYRHLLERESRDLDGLRILEPAERELRADLAPLVRRDGLRVEEHPGWLTRREEFWASQEKAPPFRMDRFYRHLRKSRGILMEDGSPVGGKYSFDAENRESWRGEPLAPEPPAFEPDDVTAEVLELVRDRFADHPGNLRPEQLPATKDDAEKLWTWALAEALPEFGPFEDAMSSRSRTLFHTRISSLLNLGRLTPRRVVRDVLECDIPLQSREGFLRQILGWREFVRHMHRETDGFRRQPSPEANEDAFWPESELDPYDEPDFDLLERDGPLPDAFWGTSPSGLHCLDTVVQSVVEEGYSHHITRLMVLCNWGSLLDVSPRRLNQWFWSMYIDAYDWVVEPNVLGMGTFGVDPVFTTKPYVSGAAYVNRMSDYCGDCRFDPKGDCPMTSMYWAFLDRHRESLTDLPRMRLPLSSLRKRGNGRRARDAETFDTIRTRLSNGECVST